MPRPRDRASAAGLLPRMEARPRKDGLTTYRYHPVNGKPINLGTDKVAACRKVLDMLGTHDDRGTITRLWQQYKESPLWHGLRERTQADYVDYSKHILRVFGAMRASGITAPMVARYLRAERGDAPKRANREISLLGNLIGYAIERGEAETNPCRGGQVRRNPERPRTERPDADDMAAILKHAESKGGQWQVLCWAAEFAARTGARQAEMLALHWPQWDASGVRLDRAKQRKGVRKVEAVEASPELSALRSRMQAREPGALSVVFANRHGNRYTSSGFAAMWGKLMREAVAAGVVKRRFTFHDLRAHYTSAHVEQTGRLPDLHASPTTTATVYNRSAAAKRKAM